MSGSTTTPAADPTTVVNTLGSVVTPMSSTPKAETKPETKPEPKAAAAPKGSFTDQILALGQQSWDKPARPNAVQIEPWTKKRPEADPVREFGSWASGLAILAGALTRTPMTTALNASAEAMKAIRAGDLATYEDQKKTWQENTDIAIKNAELQYKAYDLAYREGHDTYADRMAAITTAATTFHNEGMLRVAQQGEADRHISALQTQAVNGFKIKEAQGEYLDAMRAGQQIYEAEREKNPNLPEWKSLANTPEGRNMQDAFFHRGYVQNAAEAERLKRVDPKLTNVMVDGASMFLTTDEILARQKAGAKITAVPKTGRDTEATQSFNAHLAEIAADPAFKDLTPAQRIDRARRLAAEGAPSKPPTAGSPAEFMLKYIQAAQKAHPELSPEDPAIYREAMKMRVTDSLKPGSSTFNANVRADEIRAAQKANGTYRGESGVLDEVKIEEMNISIRPGTLAAERVDRFNEIKIAHPDWSASQIYDEVNQKLLDSKSQHFPPGVAEMIADRVMAGDVAAATGFGKSPSLLKQLDAVLTEKMAASKMTGKDIAIRKAEYAAYTQGVKAFQAGGKLEPTVRAMNNVAEHLPVLNEAITALGNKSFTNWNALKNSLQTSMGYTGPVTFNAIKILVATEIQKAVLGSEGALQDRDDLKASLKDSFKPEQLASVIAAYENLMTGQIRGLERSFNRVSDLMGQNKSFGQEVLSEKARISMAPRFANTPEAEAAGARGDLHRNDVIFIGGKLYTWTP